MADQEEMQHLLREFTKSLADSSEEQTLGSMAGDSGDEDSDWEMAEVAPGSPLPGDLGALGDPGIASSPAAGQASTAGGVPPGFLGWRNSRGPLDGASGGLPAPPDGGSAFAVAAAGGTVASLSRFPSTSSGSPGLPLGTLTLRSGSLDSPHAAVPGHPSSWPSPSSMPTAPQLQLLQQQLAPAGGMMPNTGAVPLPALQTGSLGCMSGTAEPGAAMLHPQLAVALACMGPEEQQQLAQSLLQARSQQQPLPGQSLGMGMTDGGEPWQIDHSSGQRMAGAAPVLLVGGIEAAAAEVLVALPPPLQAAAAGGRCILPPSNLARLAQEELPTQLLQLQPSTELYITAAKEVQMQYAATVLQPGDALQQVSCQEAVLVCLVGLQQWQMALAEAQGWQPPAGVGKAVSSYHALLGAPQVIPQSAITWAPEAAASPRLWWVPFPGGGNQGNIYAPRTLSYTSHTTRILQGDVAPGICRVVVPIQILDPQQQQYDTVLYLVPVQVDAPKKCQAFLLGARLGPDGIPMPANAQDIQSYPRLQCTALPFSKEDNNWSSFFRSPRNGGGPFWYGRVMGLLDLRPLAS